jgi:hypothetical protein
MTTDETEELDQLAQKYHDALLRLNAQVELNAKLMCEIKRLESELKKVRKNERTH